MLLMYFLGGGGGSQALQSACTSVFAAIGVQDWSAVQWLLIHVLHFRWFPIFGINSFGAQSWSWDRWLLDRLWYLVLPVFCLSYASFAYTSRFMRAGMIEVAQQDYVRTARAYGIAERTVIYKYAMRNALIPILTLLGEELPLLIGGSVIIESIFSIPGMGRLAYEAILSRDYPLVMGVLSITAMLTLLGIILSDILYAVTDPRIKFD
jgi:peptide/nickel transport system permease protein